MKYDTEIIATFAPLLVIGTLLIIFMPSIIKGDRSSILKLLLGGLFLLLSTAVASGLLSGNKFNFEYIINFLSLKVVGPRPYRLAAALADLLLVWSITTLFVLKHSEKKSHRPNEN